MGCNLFLLKIAADIIAIDCGIGFPAEDQFGTLPDLRAPLFAARRSVGLIGAH